MKHRPLAVLAAAAVIATVLAGCDSKVGTAARVGSMSIRESQVGQYLTDKAKPISAQGGTIIPRSYALQGLIRSELVTNGLAAHGGVPSNATVSKVEEQLKQGESDAQLKAGYTRYGFAPKMATLDLRVNALESMLASRTKAQDLPGLAKVIKQLNVPVSVSRRYGAWDPASLSISTAPHAGLPAMVSLQPSAATQP